MQEPVQKSCFWEISYEVAEDEDILTQNVETYSPVRIAVANVSGLVLYLFDEDGIYLEVNQQNITDNDNSYYDIQLDIL